MVTGASSTTRAGRHRVSTEQRVAMRLSMTTSACVDPVTTALCANNSTAVSVHRASTVPRVPTLPPPVNTSAHACRAIRVLGARRTILVPARAVAASAMAASALRRRRHTGAPVHWDTSGRTVMGSTRVRRALV